MSTEFYNRNWRMPNSFNGSEDNNSKFSNYSMSFDGSEFIQIPNISSISNVTQFSISAWINPSSIALNDKEIFTTANSTSEAIVLNLFNGDIIASVGTTSQFNRYNSAVSVGQWYHLLMVFNGSESTNADKIKLYKNGVLQTPSVNPPTLATTSPNITGNAFIGRWALANVALFRGKLDHFSIFDYALSAPQITALYGSSSTGVGNPMAITNGRKPVAYYPIGDYSAYNGTEYLVPNSAVSDYVFNFSSSKITINNNFDSIIPTTNFTLSAWVNLNSLGASILKFIFTNESLQFTITDKISTYLRGASGYFLNPFNSNTTLSTGKWYNVVLVKSESDYTYYLNSSQDGTVNNSTSVNNSSQTTSTIGTYYNNSQYYFDGKLSNVSIFNTALPATGTESVASLYNYGTPPDISSYSGLQGWWKLDASATFDGSNWSIPDDSSNSNTGTSSGMTAANLVQSNLNILSPYSRYALDLDGINDKINFSSSIDLGINCCLSLWVNLDSGFNGVIFGEPTAIYNYTLYCQENLNFYVANANVYKQFQAMAGGLTSGSWNHIVINRTGDVVECFLNGVSKGSQSGFGASSNTLFNTIGGDPSNLLYQIEGSLSNVSTFNTALTSSQVTEIYNNGLPSNLNNHSAYSNLVNWWQLGENSSFNTNWTVLNEISTGPNGVSVNMAEDDLISGVGTTANGLSSGMGGADNILGEAPFSDGNSLSYGMGVDAKSTSVPS